MIQPWYEAESETSYSSDTSWHSDADFPQRMWSRLGFSSQAIHTGSQALEANLTTSEPSGGDGTNDEFIGYILCAAAGAVVSIGQENSSFRF